MSCRYAMNLNDGREVFNSEAVATNVNYVEIDDEIHEAMKRGELTWEVVANAVRAKRNNDPNFDWAQYDVLRDRLNVRKAKFDLKDAGGSDVTNVGAAEQTNINPSVSFIEISKPNEPHASTEDNTNVGGVDNFMQRPEAKTASSIKKAGAKA